MGRLLWQRCIYNRQGRWQCVAPAGLQPGLAKGHAFRRGILHTQPRRQNPSCRQRRQNRSLRPGRRFILLFPGKIYRRHGRRARRRPVDCRQRRAGFHPQPGGNRQLDKYHRRTHIPLSGNRHLRRPRRLALDCHRRRRTRSLRPASRQDKNRDRRHGHRLQFHPQRHGRPSRTHMVLDRTVGILLRHGKKCRDVSQRLDSNVARGFHPMLLHPAQRRRRDVRLHRRSREMHRSRQSIALVLATTGIYRFRDDEHFAPPRRRQRHHNQKYRRYRKNHACPRPKFVLNFIFSREHGISPANPLRAYARKFRQGVDFGRPAGLGKIYQPVAGQLQIPRPRGPAA